MSKYIKDGTKYILIRTFLGSLPLPLSFLIALRNYSDLVIRVNFVVLFVSKYKIEIKLCSARLRE